MTSQVNHIPVVPTGQGPANAGTADSSQEHHLDTGTHDVAPGGKDGESPDTSVQLIPVSQACGQVSIEPLV